MTQPKIILGRGGENVDCDVIVSTESAVSRQHFTIRFAPELQAFEVENLSKNGILVNGEFVHRLSPPVLLRSQADIAFGRLDPMRISFLLPSGIKPSVKKKDLSAERNVPLLQWMGEAVVAHGPLTAVQLRDVIDKAHPHQLRRMGGEHIVSNSIRHILTQNDHVFFVIDSVAVENNLSMVAIPPPGGKVTDAYFGIRDDQKSRFYSVISADEHAVHKEGQCNYANCRQFRFMNKPGSAPAKPAASKSPL